MEDRKRPAGSSVDDLAPPTKRQAVNGSTKASADADMPWREDLEVSHTTPYQTQYATGSSLCLAPIPFKVAIACIAPASINLQSKLLQVLMRGLLFTATASWPRLYPLHVETRAVPQSYWYSSNI